MILVLASFDRHFICCPGEKAPTLNWFHTAGNFQGKSNVCTKGFCLSLKHFSFPREEFVKVVFVSLQYANSNNKVPFALLTSILEGHGRLKSV